MVNTRRSVSLMLLRWDSAEGPLVVGGLLGVSTVLGLAVVGLDRVGSEGWVGLHADCFSGGHAPFAFMAGA